MKQIDDVMKNFDPNFDREQSKNPILTTCIAGLIEDQRETNARIDELQKRVKALEQQEQTEAVKLPQGQIEAFIKKRMREIGELCKNNDIEFLSLCYVDKSINFFTLKNSKSDINYWEEL